MSKRKHKRNEGYWSFRAGLCEPTTEDRMEIDARKAEILAKKLAAPAYFNEVPLTRHGTSIYRAQGNGSSRRVKQVSNY